MNTIALRFSDNYAPEEGTINLHQEIINSNGYVWYGKYGCSISSKTIKEILDLKTPKILLINSGGIKRYWAYISDIQKTIDEQDLVPKYYRDNIKDIKCWLKIIRIEPADTKVMSKCFVQSSGQQLSLASKYSMNPYFKIRYDENYEGGADE